MGPRAGKLQVKKYRARRRRRVLGIVLLLLGVALLVLGRRYWMPVVWQWSPAPTLSPEESAYAAGEYHLEEQTWYALQLGVFESAEAAQAVAESYQARGAAGYVLQDESGYRVLAAAYHTRADALQVQSNLKTHHQVESYITVLHSPDVTVRMEGQKAQLDAYQSACDFLSSLDDQMYQWALQLDTGTGDHDALTAALRSCRETADELRQRLTACFGEGSPSAILAMKNALEHVSSALDKARSETSATRLGAYVKCCQMTALCEMMGQTAMLHQGQSL